MKYIAGVETGKIVPLGYRLAKMGFVVICPVCFLWHDKGEKTYSQQVEIFQRRHPASKGMAKMLFDAQRAVDVLADIEEVDSSKIGVMGHSLGGKEAFYLGAFDDRVKVIVSNEGGIGIDFSNWDDPWYLGNEIHGFNHFHHELLALCAPKPFFLIGGDSSDGKRSIPYINAVKPVYGLYGHSGNIRLYNHGQGHNITPLAEKRTYQWLVKYLK
jgi:pimeloyl-ACP methyl ester carboxylesterase